MGPTVDKKGNLERSLWEADPGVWTSRWEGCRVSLRDDKDVRRGVGYWHDQKKPLEKITPEEGERNVERPGENKKGLEIVDPRILLQWCSGSTLSS